MIVRPFARRHSCTIRFQYKFYSISIYAAYNFILISFFVFLLFPLKFVGWLLSYCFDDIFFFHLKSNCFCHRHQFIWTFEIAFGKSFFPSVFVSVSAFFLYLFEHMKLVCDEISTESKISNNSFNGKTESSDFVCAFTFKCDSNAQFFVTLFNSSLEKGTKRKKNFFLSFSILFLLMFIRAKIFVEEWDARE